jgi:hypothetical protein
MIEGINYWLWRRNISFHRGPVGGNMNGVSFTGEFEKSEILSEDLVYLFGAPNDL